MNSNWAEPRLLRFQSSALSFIFQQTPVALVGSFVNAVAYVFLSWNFVRRLYLCAWLASLLAVLLFRIALRFHWARVRETMTPWQLSRIRTWLALSICMSALAWGVMGSLFLVPESPLHFTMTVFLLAGLTAGGVAAYGSFLNLAYLFLALAVGPLVIRLIVERGAVYGTMAGLAAAYMTLMALIVFNLNRQIRVTINTGLDNEDLQRRLSAASHEIRTPVATICGFADVMAELTGTPPAARRYLEVIQRNCTYLRSLLEQMLLMGRVEAGMEAEKPRLVNLRTQIAAAYEAVEGTMKAKKLEFRMEMDLDVPESVVIQPLQVQQILVNLLTNAAKFTDAGGVKVSVQLIGPDQLAVRVSDTGIGVALENQEKLFQYFWRERTRAEGRDGAGVGLAVSHALARCMGGDLRLVSSKPGEGSIFELRLPFGRPAHAYESCSPELRRPENH